jgi:hypothetical protein
VLYIKKKSNDHVCGDEDPIWTAGIQNERLESGGPQVGSSREGKMGDRLFLATPGPRADTGNIEQRLKWSCLCCGFAVDSVDSAMIMHLQLVSCAS